MVGSAPPPPLLTQMLLPFRLLPEASSRGRWTAPGTHPGWRAVCPAGETLLGLETRPAAKQRSFPRCCLPGLCSGRGACHVGCTLDGVRGLSPAEPLTPWVALASLSHRTLILWTRPPRPGVLSVPLPNPPALAFQPLWPLVNSIFIFQQPAFQPPPGSLDPLAGNRPV